MPAHRSTEYRFDHPLRAGRTHPYDLGEQCCEEHCVDDDDYHSPSGEDQTNQKPSVLRTRFSQVLANVSSHLLVLDLCMSFTFTTIVIESLLDAKEGLSVNSDEASWLGSIAFIFQPLGSIMSGSIVEFFGRKWAMIIVNLPFLLGWILYSVSNSLTMLYVTNVILGIGIGFMEAPLMTYIAETCQPELRAVLSSLPGVTVQLAFFVVYLMGNVAGWKTTAGICASVPIITALYVTQMPETPIWLLSRGRVKEAERALCWLRGWASPDVIKEEFLELTKYNNATSKRPTPMMQLTALDSSNLRISEDSGIVKGIHDNTNKLEEQHTSTILTGEAPTDDDEDDSSHCSFKLLKEMLRPPTLRPLSLVIPIFLAQQFSGMASIRPYMVHVFRGFGLEDAAQWTTVGSAVIGIIGALVLVLTVDWLGKRFLSLVCQAGNALACLLLGIYSYVVLRPDGAEEYAAAWMPLSLIIILSFFSSVMFEVPWMMLSEIFPFRTRGIASGFSAAMCYIFIFTASKTYLDLEEHMQLYGIFFLFGAVNLFGFIYVYCKMPRMEGKTLAEIEEYFSGQNKKDFLKK